MLWSEQNLLVICNNDQGSRQLEKAMSAPIAMNNSVANEFVAARDSRIHMKVGIIIVLGATLRS